MKIKLMKSSFYNENQTKKELCNFINNAEQLSLGKYCKEFEEKYAKWQNRKYCVFFNSGSSANLGLIQSLINLEILKKGDKIGFSSLSWATNVMPLIQLGLNPIPIDVEISTLNVSLNTLKASISKNKLKCLFITNLLGFCDNIDEIQSYCNKNNILLLEDNCESMGTIYKGKLLGNYGLASTFSTFVGHHMSTIEGGIVCTDEKELYIMLNLVRAHGWDRNLSNEIQNEIRERNNTNGTFYSKYTFYNLGYNLRPNEITGFIGCQQLSYLDEIINKRNINFFKFIELVNKNNNFYNIKYDHIERNSNFAIPIICKSKKIFEKYISLFNKNDVEIRPIVGGDLTQQIFWKNIYGNNNKKTNAKIIHEQGFYFGNCPEYTNQEINFILSLLK